ncbi:MAG: 3'-5' exoribonuclease YhaM [Firmicutes bacterium ADurb.Bin182]|nr:MAG: 3'-5' exoribonuclease YhaM [Firmicutes bacterium ADurb.Bin182]
MARMKLLSDAKGNTAEGYCIVKSVAVKSNIKGASYLDLILADRDGEISAKLWDYDRMTHGEYDPDTVVKVRGTITIWKEAEQLKVDRIRNVTGEDDVDMSLLIPCAPFDSEWMYDELYRCAEDFTDIDLKRLTQYLLRENKEKLLRWPAAFKLHHALRGGLLYHTYTILRLAKSVCGIYPALDSDLVYSGVILHDIAKLTELEAGELGLASGYTAQGQLIGHITLGVAMIGKAAAELMVPDELCMLLQHMLLSHHGVPEYGSARPPMFPEAEVLSQLDMLDSRLFEMFEALSGLEKGAFTERVWALDNRQLYRHGHNG